MPVWHGTPSCHTRAVACRMAVIRSFDNYDYWPEYGTFLIVDAEPAPARHALDPALRQRGMLFGSIAIAGDGWIAGDSTDRHHHATLELHDGPPDEDEPGWVDVVESPFGTSGVIGLGLVTGGYPDDRFRLAGVGLYRVRFARRNHGDVFHYRSRFWRVDAPPEPPRWLRRGQALPSPAAGGLRPAIGDLVMTLRWAHEAGLETPAAWLADRLATTTDIIDETLRHIEAEGLMHPPPDLRPDPSSRPRTPPPGTPGGPRRAPAHEPPPPLGAPPRHGVVTRDGKVVIWRDDRQPTVLATVRPHPFRAVATPCGIVVLSGREAILVHPDHRPVLLAANVLPLMAVTAQGWVALAEHLPGGPLRSRLLLINLVTGERATYQADGALNVVGAHDDTVYARTGHAVLRWRPGTVPEPVADHVSTVHRDGTLIAVSNQTTIVIEPGGARREVSVRPRARLTPDKDFFYWYGHQPPTLFLVPADRPEVGPTALRLPYEIRAETPLHVAVWEDAGHLLVPARFGPLALRVDVRTGAIESVPLDVRGAENGVTLIEPV